MEPLSALLALCAGNSPVPVNSPHKGQWRGALMFSLIFAWIKDWVNNREAGDLGCHRGHYDINVMMTSMATMWHDPSWNVKLIFTTFGTLFCYNLTKDKNRFCFYALKFIWWCIDLFTFCMAFMIRAEFILGNVKIHLHFHHLNKGTVSWNNSSWKTGTHLLCIFSIMAADDMGIQGARASVAMILTCLSLNILVSVPEVLAHCGLVMPYGYIALDQHWLS